MAKRRVDAKQQREWRSEAGKLSAATRSVAKRSEATQSEAKRSKAKRSEAKQSDASSEAEKRKGEAVETTASHAMCRSSEVETMAPEAVVYST